MQEIMINRAIELLANGTVDRVLGWQSGDFSYDITPAIFATEAELREGFVYNAFCGANLSKYLVKETVKDGKILVFLKPCDTYSFNQLISEHRIARDKVYAIGIQCAGMADVDKLREAGISGIKSAKLDGDDFVVDTIYGEKKIKKDAVLSTRCAECKSHKHVAYDELIGDEGELLDSHRFDMVSQLENMTSDERYEFWRNELSKCIRCNACRNVCPACTCEKCVFDNPNSGVENKGAANSFEESMFHIIRAFHVVGRCTDCGECSRVCPSNIPLHLLNRKFIKDINELYGDYQAGETVNERGPLVNYTFDDVEPSIVHERGNK